jgi:hypothetical protein
MSVRLPVADIQSPDRQICKLLLQLRVLLKSLPFSKHRSVVLSSRTRRECVEKYLDGRLAELPALEEGSHDISVETKEKLRAEIKTSITDVVDGM